MGRLTQKPEALNGPAIASERLEIRWTGTVSRWSDPFDACVGDHPAGRVALVFEVELPATQDTTCAVRAWIETSKRRRVLLETTTQCEVLRDEDLTHLSVLRNGSELAVFTLNGHSRVLYARTPLLAEIGLSAGRADPPTVTWAEQTGVTVTNGSSRASDLPQPHDVQRRTSPGCRDD